MTNMMQTRMASDFKLPQYDWGDDAQVGINVDDLYVDEEDFEDEDEIMGEEAEQVPKI